MDLQIRGASVIPCGDVFGQWKGLAEEKKDHEIVWPPMVVIMNTGLEIGDDCKWKCMGNQELLNLFSKYSPINARHSYGPQGHRGMGVLIFESSAPGFLEAEFLHRMLAEKGLDRDAWGRYTFHGGVRQLYGFLATKDDLEIFNQHSHGTNELKFEMKSYQEMVVKGVRQIYEDNQQLNWFKNKLREMNQKVMELEQCLSALRQMG